MSIIKLALIKDDSNLSTSLFGRSVPIKAPTAPQSQINPPPSVESHKLSNGPDPTRAQSANAANPATEPTDPTSGVANESPVVPPSTQFRNSPRPGFTSNNRQSLWQRINGQ